MRELLLNVEITTLITTSTVLLSREKKKDLFSWGDGASKICYIQSPIFLTALSPLSLLFLSSLGRGKSPGQTRSISVPPVSAFVPPIKARRAMSHDCAREREKQLERACLQILDVVVVVVV